MYLDVNEQKPKHVVSLIIYFIEDVASNGVEPLAMVNEWQQNWGKFNLVPISGRGETEESALFDAIKACKKYSINISEKCCRKVSTIQTRDSDDRIKEPYFCEFSYSNHTYEVDIKEPNRIIQQRLSSPPIPRPLSGRGGNVVYTPYTSEIAHYHPHKSTKNLISKEILKRHSEFFSEKIKDLLGSQPDRDSLSEVLTAMSFPVLKEIREFGINDEDVRYRAELELSYVMSGRFYYNL